MREPIIEAKIIRCDYPDDRFWTWSFQFDGFPQYGTVKGKRRAKRAAKKKYQRLHEGQRRLRDDIEVETFRIGL